MLKLALYGNKRQRGDIAPLTNLINNLAGHYPEVVCSVQTDFMNFMKRSLCVPECISETFDSADISADMALSIGGDGTFLRTAARIGALETPILGINSGNLGYLSAIDILEAPGIVDDIISGQYFVEPRSVIEARGPIGIMPSNNFALNEVAILKKDNASMISVEATFGSRSTATYRADGLIVSTPTGSTGYNLSVGGPIVAPDAGTWIIAPVAPHSLNMRPLVISDESEIHLTARGRSDSFLLAIDGRSTPVPDGTTIHLVKAAHQVQVVHHRGSSFIDTLRTKLLWGIDGI